MELKSSLKVHFASNHVLRAILLCFTHPGFPEHVTVLVGVSLKGKAVAGVINQPFWGEEGRSVWGLIGLGARGFTPASCSAEGEGLVITVTRSHMSKPVQDTLDVLKPTKVRVPLLYQHALLGSVMFIIV